MSPAARQTRSTCPYCGVGCGVVIESTGEQITGVRGDPDHPANFGRLCTKGSTLHHTASAAVTLQTRLLQPMRRSERGAAPQPLGWDAALDSAATRLADIVQQHGPDAVGFYISGQLLTEDYYVFNKLAKGLLGTNNVDTNSRLCMSSAVAGYKATLGADAPPACYDDLQHAQTLFIVGSNTAFAHPILFRRIEDAKRANPALRIVVADPRRTETADAADLFLPILPGTDVALFNGMLHLMLWEGWTDNAYIAAHTSGFDALKARVRDYAPKDVAAICGIGEADLLQATRWFAGLDGEAGAARKPTLSLYCQGLNQSSHGTAKNAALINLHLATGQIGKPGAGPFSLTGQPNAMGGREVGGLANLLSAHRDLANPAHRDEVAKLWGVPSVPATPGKSAVEMFEAAADGQIKALWIACTNPAQSMPDQATVRRALQRAEFVVVQEAFATTATCAYADLLLPATTWGEKDGSVTNSERRISRVLPAVAAPGATRHDWRIATDLARRLEARLRPGLPTLFPYDDSEAVWNEHRETTRGRDLDITGLSYAAFTRTPAQWPFPEGATQGKVRLYEDGIFPTADGRARFVDTPYLKVAEPRDARHPFALNTGRLRDQWHGMSRTGTVGRLFGHVPEPAAEMNAQDMARLKIAEGDLVQLSSRRGTLLLARRGQPATGTGAGLRRDALGRGVRLRPQRHRRAPARRQRPHLAGLLPDLQAARTQARGRQGREGRAAMATARPGLAARGAGFRSACTTAGSCSRPSPSHRACPSAANAPACCSAPRRTKLHRPTCWRASKRCSDWPAPTCCATPMHGAASTAACGWSTAALQASDSCRPSCSPATSVQKPGSGRCCRTNCRHRPMAGCCSFRARRHRWPWPHAAGRSAAVSTLPRRRSSPRCKAAAAVPTPNLRSCRSNSSAAPTAARACPN